MERTVDEAVVTGKIFAIVRAVWHVAMSTVTGFFAGFGLFTGYLLGVGFLIVAVLKPIFPDNVGFWIETSHSEDPPAFPVAGWPATSRFTTSTWSAATG